jgi:hypothetical protein
MVVRDRAGNLSVAVTPDRDGVRSLLVFDREGTVRAIVDIGPDGLPTLALIENDGKARMRATLLADDSVRLVLGQGPVVSPEGVRQSGRWLADTMPTPATLALIFGLALVVLLLAAVLDVRSARWTRALQDLSRAFAEDRQRERDGYLQFVNAQTKGPGDDRALELAEAASAALVKNLEQARAEIGTLAERLQAR